MSFADRLKEYRRDRGFSQEDLADQLDVSRQAIGKWEQGQSYPEVEKLLALCEVLHVSMDALMADELPEACRAPITTPAESILILAENGINLVRCVNIMCSQPYKSRKGPKYALFGISGYTPFWGPHNNLLGWYADEPSVQQEIRAIREAMRRGESDYTLQYNAKVRRRFGRIEIIENQS
ncbi:MAG: helix-turn-helix transcriptional regulator [Oscillospiraceae bacterium]|nr:helix-turn-helix transcriptional regulator [Oscillospiraceae bacterium]